MAIWNFRAYVDSCGTDVIKQWFDSSSRRVQAKFRSRLRTLSQLDRSEWRRPLFDTLRAECAGLWEIRFECDNLQYRPLGFFQDATTFVIVMCATKKGNRWRPPTACKLALSRKSEILSDGNRCHDLGIALH
ncbi:MAG: type II toxin-antitoxin system RelE/ParE family toxin [Steroidobacteraceae bacterium]